MRWCPCGVLTIWCSHNKESISDHTEKQGVKRKTIYLDTNNRPIKNHNCQSMVGDCIISSRLLDLYVSQLVSEPGHHWVVTDNTWMIVTATMTVRVHGAKWPQTENFGSRQWLSSVQSMGNGRGDDGGEKLSTYAQLWYRNDQTWDRNDSLQWKCTNNLLMSRCKWVLMYLFAPRLLHRN